MRRGFCFVRAKSAKAEKEQELSKSTNNTKPERQNKPGCRRVCTLRIRKQAKCGVQHSNSRSTAERPARKGRMRMSVQIVFF
jgi:hypothetical protein